VGLPSVAKVHHDLGGGGVCLYVAMLGVGMALLWVRATTSLGPEWSDARAATWLALTLVCLVVAYAVVYPRVTRGSDRDEALDAATGALLRGQFPYATGPGGPISPMPGELLLAAPFLLLLGTATYQTFFWLAAFFATARASLASPRQAVIVMASMLVLCPASVHEMVTGGDLLANAIWVMVFAMATVVASSPRGAISAAIALGIGLSSRAHFAAILPIVFLAACRKCGARAAVVRCAATTVALLAVTFPFYLYDPARFSPLHMVSRLDALSGVPHAVIVSSACASVLATTWLAFGPFSEPRWLGACAFAVDVPVAVASALAWHQLGMKGFDNHAWRALSGVPFGVLGAFEALRPRPA
jgi:hypothetical protein